MSGLSCRCGMFVSCVYPVEVLVNLQIGRVVSPQFAVCVRSNSSTACRLCHLELFYINRYV